MMRRRMRSFASSAGNLAGPTVCSIASVAWRSGHSLTMAKDEGLGLDWKFVVVWAFARWNQGEPPWRSRCFRVPRTWSSGPP